MSSVLPSLTRSLREKTDRARQRVRPATREERSVFREAERRAARRKRPRAYLLTDDDVDLLVTRADGRCEATGLPFSDAHVPGRPIRPYRMSPDRLDNGRGYSLDNVRLVLAMLNGLRGDASPDEQVRLSVLQLAKLGLVVSGAAILSNEGEPERWNF